MTKVERDGDNWVVPATVLAAAFGLTEQEVQLHMHAGAITTRTETGVDEDAGRWRLTFHFRDRACRLIIDASGSILKRATFPVRTPPAASPAGIRG